ncbi:uncharacterized protein LOC132728883 [Ruditapes philippinarum]|uniref:uncharacterized protein LOC132728883 n=1 Tax=Ruditapes philippinarum TaxID=129788 RepID=UPI00295BC771|nr:uncharacterized protein LOC132728883 [Ruditapes philippinarum]
MAEGFQEVKKVAAKTDCSLQNLMNAIHQDDKIKCAELLSNISVRKLNHLVRLKYEGYAGYTVTPLLWAVIKGHHEIVQLLLTKNVNVDKIGTYLEGETLHSTSSLLVAVRKQDSKIIKFLLDNGACVQHGVPGQRMEEEEGGFLQYEKDIVPLNECIGRDIDIFKMMLSHADITLEYGTEEHTCLCYTLEHFTDDMSSLSCIKEVLRRGGVFCVSEKLKHSFFSGQKMCWNFRIFMWILLSKKCELGLERYSIHINCLRLLLCTDYSHKNSFIYNVCKHFLALVEAEGPQSEFCVEAVPPEMIQILQSTKMPSSLLHITLAAVRQLLKPVSYQKLENLNLPDRLVKCLMLDDIYKM